MYEVLPVMISRVIYLMKYSYKTLSTYLVRKVRFKRFFFGSVFGKGVNIEYPSLMEIGKGVRILDGYRIEAIPSGNYINSKVSIDDGTQIGHNFFLTSASKVLIGRDCLISDSVAIIDNNHNHDDLSVPPTKSGISSASIVIEDNVTIYRCATILSGVKVGKGAIIGAYSLVKHDVPEYSVVGGVPAKVLSFRK